MSYFAIVCFTIVLLLMAEPSAAFARNKLPHGGSISKQPLLTDGLFKHIHVPPNGTFQQLLDHGRPELGTFTQRYWFNTEYWKGPGSPFVFFTPGEVAADQYLSFLTNKSLIGVYAQEFNAATVMIEHRYYGGSSPFDQLTTKNLHYLTLNNSLADLVHFAQTVQFPFIKNQSDIPKTQAPISPWILVGGSYSGALVAWTEATKPGTFWAYHASSANVQSTYNLWEYFVPIQEGMPKNCSKDVSLVIDYVDKVLEHGSEEDKTELKKKFGLEQLEYSDDIGAALENGPWLWQLNSFTSNYSQFYEWCDYVENAINSTNTTGSSGSKGCTEVPGPEGVGLEKAVAGYAAWMKEKLLPDYCQFEYNYTSDPNDLSCLKLHDPNNSLFTDLTVDNSFNRQYTWLLCNEPLQNWLTGAPPDRPSIVSRHVTAKYFQDQCALIFPEETDESGRTYRPGSESGRTVDDTNAFTKGWSARNSTRLLYVYGQYDPWRSAGVSSDFRPGGPMASTEQTPIKIVPGSFHDLDLTPAQGRANEGLTKIQRESIEQMKAWLGEFYAQ